MEPIEGITPQALWTALYVLVAVCGLIVLWDKVRAVFAGVRERKQAKRPELADEISDKVLKKLEPRFADIDRKFANDKATIDRQARQIEALTGRADGNDEGIKALSRGVLALLNHALHNGNNDEMEEAKRVMDNYLIEK